MAMLSIKRHKDMYLPSFDLGEHVEFDYDEGGRGTGVISYWHGQRYVVNLLNGCALQIGVDIEEGELRRLEKGDSINILIDTQYDFNIGG